MQSKLLPFLQPDNECRPLQMLSEEVVFHSPIRAHHGRADVVHILGRIGGVLDEIDPQHQLAGDHQIVTIITASHHEQKVDGLLSSRA